MDPFARLKRAVGLDTTPRKEDYPNWVEAAKLFASKKYPEAERLFQQTLEELRDAGEGDTAIGMISADLARTQWRRKKFRQARETVEDAQSLLSGRRATAGLADCLEIQGHLLRDEGNPKEAIDLYREALAIQKRLPLDVERLTQRYRDLGSVLLGVNDEESRELLERGIQIARDHRGNQSLLVVRGMLELARYQATLGDQGEALDTIKQAAQIEVDDSPLSPTITEMLESVAASLVRAGKLEDAVYYYESALKIAECKVGVDVVHLAGLMTGLADIRRTEGNESAALELLQQAVAKLQGRSTHHLPAALESLGDCYAQTGRLSDAVKSYEAALACWLKEPDLHRDRIEENRAILDTLRRQALALSHPAMAKSKVAKKKVTSSLKMSDEQAKSPTTVSAADRAKFKLPKANFRSPVKPKAKPKETKEPTVIPLQIPADGSVVVTGLAPGARPPAGMGGIPPTGPSATPPGGYRVGSTMFPSGGGSATPAGSSPNTVPGTPTGRPGEKSAGDPTTAGANAKDQAKDEKKTEGSREQIRAERRLRARRSNPGNNPGTLGSQPPPAAGPVVVTPGTGFVVSSGSATPPPGAGVPLSQAGSIPSGGGASYAQPVNRGGAGESGRVPGGQSGGGSAPQGASSGPNERPGRRGGRPQDTQGGGNAGHSAPVIHGIGPSPAGSGAPAGIPGSGPAGGGISGGGLPGSGIPGGSISSGGEAGGGIVGGGPAGGGTVGGHGVGQLGGSGFFGSGGPGGGTGSGGHAGPGGYVGSGSGHAGSESLAGSGGPASPGGYAGSGSGSHAPSAGAPGGNGGPFSGSGGAGGAYPNSVPGAFPGSGPNSMVGSGQGPMAGSGPGSVPGSMTGPMPNAMGGPVAGMPGGFPGGFPPPAGFVQPGGGPGSGPGSGLGSGNVGPYPAGPNFGVYPPYGPPGGGNAFADAGPGGIRFLDPAGQPMHPAASPNQTAEMQLTVQVPGAKPLPDGTPVTEHLRIPMVPPQELRGWEELEFELLG